MGCACGISCFKNMSFFGSTQYSETDDKIRLERKLYLAKESPESVFDVSGCKLQHVPSGIYTICKVLRKEQLLLQDNALKTIDDGGILADLFMIKVLNLSSNLLQKLDPGIEYLVSLKELYLQNNKLRHLPESIGKLVNLQYLDASQNHLKAIPTSIQSLKNLRHLNLANNIELKRLPIELCHVHNLITLKVDEEILIDPPKEIVCQGTEKIMMYLCDKMGIQYVPPLEFIPEHLTAESSPVLSPFCKGPQLTWEQQEADVILQESQIHEAAKQQRQEFLSQVLKEQSELDCEIAKVYDEKEVDRKKLINMIQNEEEKINNCINDLIKNEGLKPEMLQQWFDYEQAEHDRLIAMCHENYNKTRKCDTLLAMQTLLKEEYALQKSMKEYDSYLGSLQETMLVQESELTNKLDEIYKVKDETHSHFVNQLLEDENIQKALVASLLERVDARSWSLNQEISLVTYNLARLSTIEHEKQKLQIEYNYMQLLDQRVKLLAMLDELLVQQQNRRTQLINTLQEMEADSYEHGTDFWLANYQRLIDSTPQKLRDISQKLDPELANCLLQEGVIHCLPFLVKFLFSSKSLFEITLEDLKKNGVSLSSDRENIMKAIESYLAINQSMFHHSHTENLVPPSAPVLEEREMVATGITESNSDTIGMASECIICMDNHCEIVFVPCGHMCCCSVCAKKDLASCPMCRGRIEKKIKVILA